MCAGFAGGGIFIVLVRLGKESQFCSRIGNRGNDLPAVLPFQYILLYMLYVSCVHCVNSNTQN